MKVISFVCVFMCRNDMSSQVYWQGNFYIKIGQYLLIHEIRDFIFYIQSSYTSLWDQQMANNAQDARFEFPLLSSVHMLCCVTLTMLYNFVYKAKYIILLSITDGSFYVDNSNWYGTIVIRDINSSYNNDNVI